VFFNLIDENRHYLKTWLTWPDMMDSPAVAEKYISSRMDLALNQNAFCFAIIHEDKLVGISHLVDIDLNNKKGMIGYWIAENYRGKGITTDSTRLTLKYAFEELKLHRIEIKCAVDNMASNSIPKKLGFSFEGVLRDGEWLHDRFIDQNLYSLLSTK
jgi:ribosomal-protein-serine acetyltransferase